MPHPLLERREALWALGDALRDVTPNRPGFVVVTGEAGIGKTRLVDEFLKRAGRQSRTIRGSAFAATSNTPYGVWIDALAPFLRSMRRREADGFIGDLPDLARLFQDLGRPSSSTFGHSLADGVSDQIVLFGQLRVLLSRIAHDSPLCIFIDDLHWADRSSIEALHFIVRGSATQSILIVGACRPDESGIGTPLGSTLNSLDQMGMLTRLELAPLSSEATNDLAARISKAPVSPTTLRELYQRTRGNPFFTIELLRHVDRGEVCGATSAEPVSLPESIGQLFGARVARLSEDPRRIVAVAAVIGARAEYDLLRDVTRFDEERLLGGLDELCALGLLDERVEGSAVTYEFRHPLVQEAVYGSLGAARRRYLHRLVAAELMRTDATSGRSFAIARHLAAGVARDRRKDALPYLIRAAYDAIAVFANHEVIAFFSAALGSIDKTDDARFDLLRELGEAHKRLGDFTRAVAIWEEALHETADARRRAVLRRCIARALWQAGHEEAGMAHLEAGVLQLGEAALTSEGALLRQELAQERMRLGDVDGAIELAETMLAALDPSVAPEAVARLQIVLCTAHGYRGERELCERAGARAVQLCEANDLPGAAFLARYTLAAFLRYDGDESAFFTNADAASEIAMRMHSTALESWPLSIKTERLTFEGRFEEAIAAGDAALAIDRTIGQGFVLPRTAAFLGVAKRLTGDLETGRALVEEAAAFIEERGKNELRTIVVVRSAGAYLDYLDGKLDDAASTLDDLLARLQGPEPLRFYLLHPYVLPLAAMIAAGRGDMGAAKKHVTTLEELVPRPGSSARASALHASGLIAASEGRESRAMVQLQRSFDAWEQLGRPYFRWRTLSDLAELREQSGDRSGAVEAMLEVVRGFEGLGAAADAACAARRLRHWGVRAGIDVKRKASGAAISRRERQVVKHIARGSLNREIATDLGISELTVETHVRNILRKLGLRSRTQVAARAEILVGDERGEYATVP